MRFNIVYVLSYFHVSRQTHLLYLNLDNSLHDCIDIESGDVIDSDIVQDYKRMSMRLSHPGGKVMTNYLTLSCFISTHHYYAISAYRIDAGGLHSSKLHVRATLCTGKSKFAKMELLFKIHAVLCLQSEYIRGSDCCRSWRRRV